MLQQPKRPPVPPFNLEKEIAPASEEQQSNLVQQYLQENISNNIKNILFSMAAHLEHI